MAPPSSPLPRKTVRSFAQADCTDIPQTETPPSLYADVPVKLWLQRVLVRIGGERERERERGVGRERERTKEVQYTLRRKGSLLPTC
ncbi:hypothetical protein JZ751_001608 [Albula glossodonta]|uniref:Uncharacterized protein n=1 Tax=Albula glossodonta TaxID=121402 RepID=A0A8T2PU64_9TELE|nr:hypothetical protein JZ751_001608 [Albula glossodonta]